MKTVFIIINYNDAKTTEDLIHNIKDYPNLDLIVLLDNKSSDDSFDYLYKNYHSERIHVIQSEANKGYAYAMNYGSHYAQSIFGHCNVILSNPDVEIDDVAVIDSLLVCKAQNQAAIVAPVIREREGLSRGWRIPTPIKDSLLNIVYIHWHLRPILIGYKDSYYENQRSVPVEAVLGCFFIIDTLSLEKVDYFDEKTFLYYEEDIIAKKLKNAGLSVYLDCTTSIFHNHSVSIDKSLKKLKKFQQLKKSQYYFQTTYNHANLIERFLLKATYSMSYFIFKIIYSIQS